MTVKNIFEHPLNATEDEIIDFVLRRVWMWSDSSDKIISIHIAVGDSGEKFYVSVEDLWRLKDLVKNEYPQAIDDLGYEIQGEHYDEDDNVIGISDVVFHFTICSGCCLHS